MNEINLDSNIGTITTGNSTVTAGNNTINTWSGWYDVCDPLVKTYYYPYWNCWHTEKNKIEQSFKIVQKLQDIKLIKINTVKQFIEVINKISEIL